MTQTELADTLTLGIQMGGLMKSNPTYEVRRIDEEKWGQPFFFSIGYWDFIDPFGEGSEWIEHTASMDQKMAEAICAQLQRRIKMEFDQSYVLRLPCSEAMISIRKHGHLQKLKIVRCEDYRGTVFAQVWFYDTDKYVGHTEEIGWIRAPFTSSEVGIMQEGDDFYAYLPDLSEDPEKIQEGTRRAIEMLNAIFTNAGAETVTDLGGL